MNSNIDPNYGSPKKSARELKAEVMQDLKKLNQDVDQLKDHLTPGQIIDDVLFYRQMRTPRASFEYLRDNPIGTSFLAIGTLLLMEDQQNRSYESIARAQATGVIDSARTSYDGIRTNVQGKVDSVRAGVDSVKNKIDDVKDKVGSVKQKVQVMKTDIQDKFSGSGTTTSGVTGTEFNGTEFGSPGTTPINEFSANVDQIKTNLNEVKGAVGDKVQDIKGTINAKIPGVKEDLQQGLDEAKSKFSGAKDTIKQKFSSGVDSAKETFQEGIERARGLDPLTYVVLGAGLGTLTGASIPLFESEKGLADKYEGKFSQFSTDLENALNQSANILKNEFFGGLSGIDLKVFGRGSQSQSSASF